MKVFISADIEGITGLVSWSQCGKSDGKYFDYPFARKMMTHDVNAAIRGAKTAGASEVVVKDSHNNSKNLIIEELEPGTRLISGGGHGLHEGMMQGVSGEFHAAILIGYHGMAGTLRGVMEHTLTGGIHRLKINGKETGEIGLSTFTAGRFNVPVVAISSDRAGCDEATDVVKGISTAKVKFGLGRYAAELLHPSVTGPMIEKAVFEGVKNCSSISPIKVGACELEIEYNRSEAASDVSLLPGLELVNAYTVRGKYPDFEAAHCAIWAAMDLEAGGHSSQF